MKNEERLLRSVLILALAVMGSCATIDQSTLSASCRGLYNACLNACATTNARSSRASATVSGPSGDAIAQSGGGTQGNNTSFQIDTAACTRKCNDDILEAKAARQCP